VEQQVLPPLVGGRQMEGVEQICSILFFLSVLTNNIILSPSPSRLVFPIKGGEKEEWTRINVNIPSTQPPNL